MDEISREAVTTSGVPPKRNVSGRRRTLRWLAPVGAAGVVALVASGALSADAKPNLPPQTAAQLLASVGRAEVAGFSGTVVEKASLGLPQLPNLGGDSSSTGLLGMLSGSHTSRIWYAGPTKQRIALLGALGEQDVFRDGRELWQWDSDTKNATHTVLPAGAAKVPTPAETATMTPSQAAEQALQMIDPTTAVSTDSAEMVAGRAAYTLVLSPKDAKSRVGSVRISLDGKTKVPLGVQVIARGATQPALDVSFTRIDFSTPSDDFFSFAPPPGANVKQSADQPKAPVATPEPKVAAESYQTIGNGWTTVAKLTGVPSLADLGKQSKDAAAVLGGLPTVSGTWGTGRLFSSALINALFTSDGRVFVGAVDPDVLYQAAGQK
jgi:outer membrane lipoprotein-sorting protein